MKTQTTTILIILLLLSAVIIIPACTANHATTTEVLVLRDITETHLAQPIAQDIQGLFVLESDKWNGAIFRFADITDVSYNRTHETHLDVENQWLGNEFERKEKVKKFYSAITQILTDAEKENTGKSHSAIYLPVASILNELAQSKSEKRFLLIYSDLMENENAFSFYRKKLMNLLKTNPDSVKKYFEAQLPLQNLNGIQVYLLYQPSDSEKDEQYKIVSGFYKKLLESKGAKVNIQANL